MKVIEAHSVNEALYKGLNLIVAEGVKTTSRAGDTIEVPYPVTTVYNNPSDKVLLSKVRDCNPFFHVMEALWILAGRSDTKFLCEFNKRMVDFSDNGKTFNAPYGARMRGSSKFASKTDQIAEVVRTLKDKPDSRQAILQIWDKKDLWNYNTKDKACNMQVVFRLRNNRLDMTVYNRSNDIIWGAYGANVVQFSTLHEYVAAHLFVKVGTYYHVSNSYHVYTGGRGGEKYEELVDNLDEIISNIPIYNHNTNMSITGDDIINGFDTDMLHFFYRYDNAGIDGALNSLYGTDYFNKLVIPMLEVWKEHKSKHPVSAVDLLENIESENWKQACSDWLLKRYNKGIA